MARAAPHVSMQPLLRDTAVCACGTCKRVRGSRVRGSIVHRIDVGASTTQLLYAASTLWQFESRCTPSCSHAPAPRALHKVDRFLALRSKTRSPAVFFH